MTKKNYRTVRTKVYRFDALSEEAKKKAIDKFRYFNVEFEWWDFTFEDFKNICEKVGVTVDLKKTYFSGFSSQGDGAGFTAAVDLFQLVEGINAESWRVVAPTLDKDNSFTPDRCIVQKRILRLIKSGCIDFSVDCEGRDRPYRTKANIDYDFSYNECINYDNILRELGALAEWAENVIDELSSLLYNLLEKEYDWQTSDEAVIETIEANEYEFLADGTRFS